MKGRYITSYPKCSFLVTVNVNLGIIIINLLLLFHIQVQRSCWSIINLISPIFTECPQGFYGKKCMKTCDCLNGAPCDSRNGQCLCKPGYMGDRCESGE